jgi:glutamate dehydrogenase (NAD(P)+)
MDIRGARVAVQGFGNVGSVAARLFQEAGAIVVAVQDHKVSLYDPAGLDVPAMIEHASHGGTIDGFRAEKISSEQFWQVDCDILIPAALEGQITAKNAPQIKARMVIEGANGPTTPEADDILRERNILVAPDVIANAGGVTVSYFEWVQDFSSFFWTEEEINQRLVRIMQEAFRAIWQVAQDNKVTLRTAAFIVACTRILQAREMRGLYP